MNEDANNMVDAILRQQNIPSKLKYINIRAYLRELDWIFYICDNVVHIYINEYFNKINWVFNLNYYQMRETLTNIFNNNLNTSI